jgi:uncharacterized protein (TIGR03067 family)
MSLPSLLLLAALLPADATVPVDAPPPPAAVCVEDAGELQGEWEVVACVISEADCSRILKDERWAFRGTSACSRGGNRGYEVRADPSAGPATLDAISASGCVRRGVYRRTGDELLWALGMAAGNRPSSFEPARGVTVWTLRRVMKRRRPFLLDRTRYDSNRPALARRPGTGRRVGPERRDDGDVRSR